MNSMKNITQQSKQWHQAMHGWLAVDAPQHQPAAVFQALEGAFTGHLIFSRAAPKQRGNLFYTTCCVFQTNKPVLCVTHARAATFSFRDVETICSLLAAARTDSVVVLCNAPFFADEQAREIACRLSGLHWTFLTWLDVEEAIARLGRGEPTHLLLARGSLVFADLMLVGDAPKFSWNPGQAPTDALADRALPNLRFLLEQLPARALVADFGAGRGRHSLYAARWGHVLLAVEKRTDTFAELALNLERAGVPANRMRLVEEDYLDVRPLARENIALLIAAGVLQHACDREDLSRRLSHLAAVTPKAGAMVFIEMLFDMKFDGKVKPGRVKISVPEFEALLLQVFPAAAWSIERVAGPVSQTLDFSGGGRSFFSEAKMVEQTAVEYLLTRRT